MLKWERVVFLHLKTYIGSVIYKDLNNLISITDSIILLLSTFLLLQRTTGSLKSELCHITIQTSEDTSGGPLIPLIIYELWGLSARWRGMYLYDDFPQRPTKMWHREVRYISQSIDPLSTYVYVRTLQKLLNLKHRYRISFISIWGTLTKLAISKVQKFEQCPFFQKRGNYSRGVSN